MVSGEHLGGAQHFSPEVERAGSIKTGDEVEIIGQRACMVAVAHPWRYMVDSSTVGGADRVVGV